MRHGSEAKNSVTVCCMDVPLMDHQRYRCSSPAASPSIELSISFFLHFGLYPESCSCRSSKSYCHPGNVSSIASAMADCSPDIRQTALNLECASIQGNTTRERSKQTFCWMQPSTKSTTMPWLKTRSFQLLKGMSIHTTQPSPWLQPGVQHVQKSIGREDADFT